MIAIIALGFVGFYPVADAEALAVSTSSANNSHGSATPDGPAPVPHAVEREVYYRYCTRCHGFGKMKPFPESHAGFAAKSCSGCHKIGSTPEVQDSSAGKSMNVRPRPVPHPIDRNNYRDCTHCHGIGKMKPFPANHVKFAAESCAGCHQPASGSKLP